jgi:hypothetical protein
MHETDMCILGVLVQPLGQASPLGRPCLQIRCTCDNSVKNLETTKQIHRLVHSETSLFVAQQDLETEV